MSQILPSVRGKMAILSIASLMVMAYVDYITGYELVFSAAYIVPIVFCAWHFGVRSILLMSIASGVANWLVDMNHPYSNSIVQFGTALPVSLFPSQPGCCYGASSILWKNENG
jgi:hypothetical protein